MARSDIDPKFLEQRLKDISEGLREAIRREVKRLRELGLPVCVERNGRISER